MRKQSKQSISLIQRKIWQECRRIIKNKYGTDCYTCPAKNLIGSNCQLGHLYPKACLGAFLKYDLRVLRFQCFRCNINLGGNGAVYYQKILEKEGQQYLDQIEKDKQIIVKAYDHYQKTLEEYKQL